MTDPETSTTTAPASTGIRGRKPGPLARFWLGSWWWLVPLAALLVPALLIYRALQSESVVAPFVYTVL